MYFSGLVDPKESNRVWTRGDKAIDFVENLGEVYFRKKKDDISVATAQKMGNL